MLNALSKCGIRMGKQTTLYLGKGIHILEIAHYQFRNLFESRFQRMGFFQTQNANILKCKHTSIKGKFR